MVFNGLTGSDLVVFNALLEVDLSQPVSASQLADITCYHPFTVHRALRRLLDYAIIERDRAGLGHAYRYKIRTNGNAVSHS